MLEINGERVYLGGDGKEVPPYAEDMLGSLEGRDVSVGVVTTQFDFGSVATVVCYDGRAALGVKSEWNGVVASCEALRRRADWRASAMLHESGGWRKFLELALNGGGDVNHALAGFLQNADSSSLARDIVGWHARNLGLPSEAWPSRTVVICQDVREVEDVYVVAQLVAECLLDLPPYLPNWFRWDRETLAKKLWMASEIKSMVYNQ